MHGFRAGAVPRAALGTPTGRQKETQTHSRCSLNTSCFHIAARHHLKLWQRLWSRQQVKKGRACVKPRRPVKKQRTTEGKEIEGTDSCTFASRIRGNHISGVSSNSLKNVSFQNRGIVRGEFRAKINSYSFHPGQCIVRGSQRKTYSCHCTTPEARYPWEYLYRLGRIYSTYSKQKKTRLSQWYIVIVPKKVLPCSI